jgi:hypothetical protein
VALANDHGAGAASALGLGNMQAAGTVAIGSFPTRPAPSMPAAARPMPLPPLPSIPAS